MPFSENFMDIWEAHATYLYKFIRASVKSHHDAEDVMHETLIRAALSIDKLRDSRKAKPWLSRIAVYAISDYYKKNGKELLLRNEDFDSTIKKYENIDLDALQVRLFLEALPDDWRWILILHFYYDMSAREVAAYLGRNFHAINKRITRLKKKLIIALSDVEGE